MLYPKQLQPKTELLQHYPLCACKNVININSDSSALLVPESNMGPNCLERQVGSESSSLDRVNHRQNDIQKDKKTDDGMNNRTNDIQN